MRPRGCPAVFLLVVASYRVLNPNRHPTQLRILLGTGLQSAPHSPRADTLASEDPEPTVKRLREASHGFLCVCGRKNGTPEKAASRGLPPASRRGIGTDVVYWVCSDSVCSSLDSSSKVLVEDFGLPADEKSLVRVLAQGYRESCPKP